MGAPEGGGLAQGVSREHAFGEESEDGDNRDPGAGHARNADHDLLVDQNAVHPPTVMPGSH